MNESPSAVLLNVDHVAFRVSDLDAAIALLPKPFEQVSRTDTRAVVRYANITVAFVLGDRHPNHLAFSAVAESTREDGRGRPALEWLLKHTHGSPVVEYSDGARAVVVPLAPENSFAVEHLTKFPNESH